MLSCREESGWCAVLGTATTRAEREQNGEAGEQLQGHRLQRGRQHGRTGLGTSGRCVDAGLGSAPLELPGALGTARARDAALEIGAQSVPVPINGPKLVGPQGALRQGSQSCAGNQEFTLQSFYPLGGDGEAEFLAGEEGNSA